MKSSKALRASAPAPRWFFTDRRLGDTRARGALAQVLRTRGWPVPVAVGEQVHGNHVRVISTIRDARRWKGVDGFLTDRPGIPLGIFTADCLPIFLSADRGRVVGVLHAGWRGVKKGILLNALRRIRARWGIPAKQVEIWTGPSIGVCCFEVGWDVARVFPRSRVRRKGRWFVDLNREVREQSRRFGARFRKPTPPLCTRHQSRFFSYRRDATKDRQVSVIMKPN